MNERRTAPALAAPPPAPTPAPQEGRLGRFWHDRPPALRAALAVAGVAFVLLAVMWTRCGIRGCPDVRRLASYRPGGAPVLLDREGRPFGDLAPVEGELVTLKSLPKHVPQAFLAVEDRRFYEHGAVDWMRVAGALWANVRSHKVEEGSSTITMQLARNVFPDRIPGQERTLARKLLEVRVAFEIEDDFEKDEILELYLNHIYFGNGARGIEAAARHYFGVHARELSLPQAALLAALPKGPGHYDPRRHPEEARERRDLVLSLMAEQGRIDAAAADRPRAAPARVARRRAAGDRPVFAGYFIEEVRRQLEELMGGDLYDQRLRIRTTLDSRAQRAAEQELQRQLARDRERGPSAVSPPARRLPAGRGGDDGGRGGRRAGLGGRPRLQRVAVRPGEGRAPAGGQRVQALRLRRGPGRRPHAQRPALRRAPPAGPGRAPAAVLGAAQLRRAVRGAGDGARGAGAIQERAHRPPGPGRSGTARGRRLRRGTPGSSRPSPRSRPWRWAPWP